MKWHKCYKCKFNEVTNDDYQCDPCDIAGYLSSIKSVGGDATEETLANWNVEQWGHWKHADDLLCRCCHTDKEIKQRAELMEHAFNLKGAL